MEHINKLRLASRERGSGTLVGIVIIILIIAIAGGTIWFKEYEKKKEARQVSEAAEANRMAEEQYLENELNAMGSVTLEEDMEELDRAFEE